MKRGPYLLCPAAHAEATARGLVIRCATNPHHVCNGERTAYLWTARDNKGESYMSTEPHCGSCESDDEYMETWRGEDEACCCAHGEREVEPKPATAQENE